MSSLYTIFTVVSAILILYAILCFIAHYLDFGWKIINGDWLHEDIRIIKWMRIGFIHKLLIGFILTIIMYGGLSQILAFIPPDWGRVDEAGKLHSYRLSITSALALVLAGITMYGFHMADNFLSQQDKPKQKR
ncbi:hypothetical protein GCM10027592_02810 [Spirosoma flavus]